MLTALAIRILTGTLLILAALFSTTTPATASTQPDPGPNPGFECPDGQYFNGEFCEIRPDPEDPGPQPEEPETSGCTQNEPLVTNAPCEAGGLVFHQPMDCYIGDVSEEYPGDHDIWQGNYPDGVIVRCQKLAGVADGIAWHNRVDVWMDAMPAEEPPVDPAEVAADVLADMDLEPIEIGIAPAPGEDSAGLVGLPNWMWVANPTPQTFGENTATGSEGDTTVTVTATAEQVQWDMGNGTTVACGPGTPWQPTEDIRESPDCGHMYTEVGIYPVTATTAWAVAWESNDGVTGVLEVDPMTSEVTIHIRELQAVRID